MVTSLGIVATAWLFVPAYLANMAPVLVQGRFESLAVPIDGGAATSAIGYRPGLEEAWI